MIVNYDSLSFTITHLSNVFNNFKHENERSDVGVPTGIDKYILIKSRYISWESDAD